MADETTSPPPPPVTDRILLIRPSALGDVCRTVPVLASLRAAWPDARIDWVVQDSFVDAVSAHPALTNVIPFPRRHFAKAWRSPSQGTSMFRWFDALRRTRYDLVIDAQGLGRSGLMTLATLAPRRVGLRHAREFAWTTYTTAAQTDPNAHTVDAMLALVDACGIPAIADMRLFVRSEDQAWAIEALEGEGPLAVLAPTSRWLSKRWPAERWAELVPELGRLGYGRCVVLGAPNESDQLAPFFAALERVNPDVPVQDLSGKTSIGQTMAVIGQGSMLIANDSAPLHMAVGLGTPSVGLFGPTDPARVGPYRADESVVQKYDSAEHGSVHYRDAKLGDRLMRLISVDDVSERVAEIGRTMVAEADVASPEVL